MDGDRKFQVIFVVVSALLFGFAYGIGYYVGKGKGIEEEKKICEIEKKQIVKTLSRIAPVSRPEPIEEKVVGEKTEVEAESENKSEVASNGTGSNGTGEEITQVAQVTSNQTEVEKTEEIAEEKVKNRESEEKTEEVKSKEEKIEKEREVKQNQSGKYYLQVGVFRNKENALKLAERLQKLGFKPKTIYTSRYVKVAVGYFQTKREALKTKKELSSHGISAILKRRK
jgi:cell division protein FtsN